MRLLRIILICSTLLLGGCWIQEKSEPDVNTATPDELAQASLLRMLRANSYHYDMSLESTIQYTNKDTGRIMSMAKGDRMKLHTGAQTSSNTIRTEFSLPAQSDIGAVSGTIDADTIHAADAWFIELHKLETKHPGLQSVFDTYLSPYLDQWVALSPADVTQITTPVRTSVLGYISQLWQSMFPDERMMSDQAKGQLRTLQDNTTIFNVVREETPTVSNDHAVRVLHVELDTAALLNYIKQVSQIIDNPMTNEEGAALRAFLQSAEVTGIIEVEEATQTPFQITLVGSLLESQSPTEKIQHSTMEFEMDVEFSNYGTMFTITEPSNPESFEVVLDSIFSKPMDLEANENDEELSE